MKQLILIIMILLLSACATPETQPVIDPALAAQQARSEAEYFSLVATGTAQAQIVPLTQTAAGLIVNQTQVSMDKTSIAASWTATPSVTPSLTATPTVNVTGTLAVYQMQAAATQIRLDTERSEINNTMKAVIGYVFAGLLMVLGILAAYVMLKRLAMMPNPVDGFGKATPIINVLDGIAWDIERSSNGLIGTTQKYLAQLPQITAERQDAVTARAQMVDMATRRARLPKSLVDMQGNQSLLPADTQASEADLFPLPNWDDVLAWDFNKDRKPIGTSDSGLEFWDVRNYPHLAIFGRSGAGKSRRSLRPLITTMLAAGERVILVGKESDYVPFIGHPNMVFVPVYDVTDRTEALKYFNVLSAAVVEKNRRIREMSGMRLSLWQGERTYLVCDELGNALLEMPDDIADDTLRKARSIVNEARKAGLSLVFSAQRPKGFIDLTTQCGRVVFQVETDQEKGYALGFRGADRLPDVPIGYFYRKFSSVKVTGAFEPSDEQIRAFLQAHQVSTLPSEDWIEGVLVDAPKSLPDQPTHALPDKQNNPPAQTLAGWLATLKPNDLKLIELYQMGGMSNAEMERSAYGYTNGSTANKSKQLIEQYRAFTTTTTTTTPEIAPNLGFLPA